MAGDDLKLFGLERSRAFAERVAAKLGVALARHEERDFEDGEHKARPLENLRGRDVFVIHSLYGEPGHGASDKLARLLFFIGALKDASAARVTAVVPYLAYARKDRKTQTRDPVTTRYVASLFEAVGTDLVVTIDVHNLAAFQNAFRCRTDHLEARPLFIEHFLRRLGDAAVAVVSPDIGGVKRAERFRDGLEKRLGREVPTAFLEKKRALGVVSGGAVIVGEVEGRVALIIDDLIATGTTIGLAARALRARNVAGVFAAASHGLFVGKAAEVLADPALDGMVVTDSVPPFRLAPDIAAKHLTVVETAPLFAEAIRRIHDGGSLVDLLDI